MTNMGDYKGWTGLSPPAAYPSTVEREMYSQVPPDEDITPSDAPTVPPSIM
jgi:hypothetical protein